MSSLMPLTMKYSNTAIGKEKLRLIHISLCGIRPEFRRGMRMV